MVEGNKKLNVLRGLAYLAPSIILLAIFTFYPIINTFVISFNEGYNYLTGAYNPSGWGFGNYAKIFSEGNPFPSMLLNTMIIVFVSVPISIILSLLIAVALNSIKPLQKFLQTIFFLPYVTNTIAIGMVFSVMFESQQGLVNTILNLLGKSSVNWLGGNVDATLLFGSQYFTSLVVLLVYIIWNSLPFKVLILLSALQSIDKQYYQAAQIDGTSKIRTFTKIIVPLLSPQIFYLLITSFIGAFKEYTSVVAIFGKNASSVGSHNNMATVVWYIYNKIEAGGKTMGYAAAGAVILFLIIMFFTAINKVIEKKKVHF
jgi:multiple sugar transport system permease protein